MELATLVLQERSPAALAQALRERLQQSPACWQEQLPASFRARVSLQMISLQMVSTQEWPGWLPERAWVPLAQV